MKYILFILIIALSCPGIAQTASGKGGVRAGEKQLTAGIYSGLSFPLGKYRSAACNGVKVIEKGAVFGADAHYFFSRHAGLNLSFSYQFQPVNATAMARQRGASDARITKAVVKAGSFQLWDVSAGWAFRFPLARHWNISWTAGGGILWTTTPAITENIRTDVPTTTKITAARAASFVYKSRLSVQYGLTPALSLGIFGEGGYSKPSFSFRHDATVINNSVHLSFLNTGIGLRYALN